MIKKLLIALGIIILVVVLFDFLKPQKMTLKQGDKVPVFTLKDQYGNDFNLASLVGKKALVIFFYPADFTPGCIKEVCSFRDQYQDFTDAGAEVIGISGDGQGSHQKFAAKYKLPYTLLSDPDKKVRKLFGVKSSLLGLLPGRVTYVVDKSGLVQLIFENQFGAAQHISASLSILQKL